MLIAAGVGRQAEIDKAAEINHGFGVFVRSLVGLDRAAAVEAFADFLNDQAATPEQIEFIDMVIEHLTEKGVMDPALLYESPFSDIAPTGPENAFDMTRARKIVDVINEFNATAAG